MGALYRAARSTLFDLAAGLFIVLLVLAGTPSAHATAATASGIYDYDAPTGTRVEVYGFGVAEARPMQASDVREWSASPSAAAQGTSTTSSVSVVATEAAGAGDALVLGKYPDYIKLADELGARRFSIPDAEWNALTPEARWAANQAVLDQAITDRIPIVLSNPATPEFLTGTYGDEIAYLIKQGYEIGPNAMSMVPKGG
jgi:hypothetical protein